jgi:DNA-binding GntR family transcriptional regulator
MDIMVDKASLRVSRNAVTLRQQVLEVLRGAIVDNRFRPGERLVERELCELTGVSRTSVREALRHLESEGLVQSVPNKGPIVAKLDLRQAQQIFEVRAALEGMAGRLFAERATAAQRDDLRAAAGRLERAFTGGKQTEIDKAASHFYQAIFAGCGNEVVSTVLGPLNARITYLRGLSLGRTGRSEKSLAEMLNMASALISGSPEAAEQACVDHVKQASESVLAALEQQQAVQAAV